MVWNCLNLSFVLQIGLDTCANGDLEERLAPNFEKQACQVGIFISETVATPLRKWIEDNCFELDISNSYNREQGYF